MIGLVLVTHGALAGEFKAAMEHVVGEQEYLVAISIGPDDDMDERRSEIVEAVKAVNNDNGVVLLTDMFGGTPSNLAISMMDMPNVEVIAGVNLPMLIKFAAIRETLSLDEASLQVQEAGRKYISIASQVLAG